MVHFFLRVHMATQAEIDRLVECGQINKKKNDPLLPL